MLFCSTGFQIKRSLPLEANLLKTEFFVLTTLENYHQISHSGPWSATYDFGVITFCKINETF